MFSGRVAIITGGASGIGLACATGFANNGALGVIIADIDDEGGEKEAKKLKNKTKCDVRYINTDVSNEESVKKMVNNTVETWERIDILVNNAGVCPRISWNEATKESWDKIIGINLTGMFLCTKEVAPYMQKRKNGRIIFVSSTAAMDGSHIAHVAYGVTKAGALALMKSTAKEFAKDNILATAIMPGPIETAISASFTESQRKNMANATLLKRYGKSNELAEAVMFLAGPGATYITGTTLQVSGGEFLY